MRRSATAMRRHGSVDPTGHGVRLPVFHPAAQGSRSIFPSRLFEPDEVARVLKDGHQSRKIGAFVSKGRLKGCPIFTLTLEERATCPRTCTEWLSCYGNNMQAAERIDAGEGLTAVLGRELRALALNYPAGFLVRLHVLGDFFSVEYVRFWHAMLHELPALHLFGFTARHPASEIGRAIGLLALEAGWHRAAIRFSGAPHELRAARVLAADETDADAIACPAQQGKSDCCGTCGLCWQSERSIAFRRH